jgi:hypothetical protein
MNETNPELLTTGVHPLTIADLRRNVKKQYPHVKISIRTVSFQDLARCSRKCLEISQAKGIDEIIAINAWAKQAGVIQDSSMRFFPSVKTA